MQCTLKRRCKHIKRNDVDLGVSDEIYCVATCYAMFVHGIDDFNTFFSQPKEEVQADARSKRHVRPSPGKKGIA